MHKILTTVATLAISLILFAGSASALNQIYLSPPNQSVLPGATFDIDLMMNFDEVMSGGGVEISFGPLVTFQSFSFDPLFTGNFGLSSPADAETILPLEIGFGFFFPNGPDFGESGLHKVGTLSFLAVGAGATQMITTGPSALSPGPFFDPAATPLDVSFSGAVVNIASVPEPSTALLIGLGLICFSSRARSRAFGEIE